MRTECIAKGLFNEYETQPAGLIWCFYGLFLRWWKICSY